MWRRAPRSSSETDKFRLRHKMFHIPFCMFKVSKKTQKNPHRTTCQIYSKLTIKIPERHLVLFLLLTLNTFYTLFHCYYCWIWSNKSRLNLRNSLQTRNLFSVIERNILSYGLGIFVELYVFILIHST